MSIGNTKKDGSGAAWWQRVDGYGRALVQPAWTHVLQSDTNLNDSDKTFTVPALKEWDIQSILVELSTTATVGNRFVVVDIQNASADVIMRMLLDNGISEDNVTHVTFCNWGGYVMSAVISSVTLYTVPLPPLVLPAGYIIRVYDAAAIAAAADDMIVHIRALQRDLFEEPA